MRAHWLGLYEVVAYASFRAVRALAWSVVLRYVVVVGNARGRCLGLRSASVRIERSRNFVGGPVESG